MTNTLIFNNNSFDIPAAMSAFLLSQRELIAVDASAFLMAEKYACPYAISRLEAAGVDFREWEVVGERFEDLTHWCEIENKIEYMHDHGYLH